MPLKSEEAMKLENRLAMKVVASALEAETEALLARRRLEERAQATADAHLKDYVHIVAYKIALETAMQSGRDWSAASDDEKDHFWLDSVDAAVKKLRGKGHKVLDKHIPKLKERVIDLGKIDLESGDQPRAANLPFPGESVLPPKVPKDVWEALHRVWTFAVGKPGYDKGSFQTMENAVVRMSRGEDANLLFVDRGRILEELRELERPSMVLTDVALGEAQGKRAALLAILGMTEEQLREQPLAAG